MAIIIPVYNAGNNILNTYYRVTELIKLAGIQQPLIVFVNDASTDNSAALLQQIVSTKSYISLINLKKNSGQNAALFTGINYAEAPLIMTIDDDFPFDPAELALLINNHISAGKKITFGIPASHKQGISAFLKLFFPSYRNIDFHSSLRIFDGSVRKLITENKTLYPAIFLKIKARDMNYQLMHSYQGKSESRYNMFRYFAYYRAEIGIILMRLFGLLGIITLVVSIYNHLYLWAVAFCFTFFGLSSAIYLSALKDYSRLHYRVNDKTEI
ncbi:MAG TPA: glycosyltransferase family 2 protein [Chitinophagales bacterium]|nr:glycosyltransferase family 2 protein [Chitinophagales bacterium]